MTVPQRSATGRPCVVLLMDPTRTRHMFDEPLLKKLAAVCELPAPQPLRKLDAPMAKELLGGAEILLTSWGAPRLTADTLELVPNLRLIAHAAGTVRHLVAPELFVAGVTVTHAAVANALPVAEYTLAAILFSNKRVFRFQQLYREARDPAPVVELAKTPLGNYGKTVGIVGASRIGRRVIELLRPFDLRVLLYDPFVAPEEASALGAEPAPLEALLEHSDIVSLHAPSLPSTRHMLDRAGLARLRDGATLINTARGALVDQAALEAELVSGRIDAVIDVTDPEVLPATSPLYDLPNVLLTPHIAGALGIERRRLGELAVAEIERYARGLPLQHAIDPRLLERMA